MSVSYEVKEHLIVNDIPKHDRQNNRTEAVTKIHNQLYILGALMLQDEAKVFSMKLVADDRTYKFSGNCPDEIFKELMNAVCEADNVDLSLHYEYTVRGMNEVSHEAGPVLGAWMEEFDVEEAEGIFYTVWILADCEDGEGTLRAYGEHNGKFYNGQVEFESVESFRNGVWYANEDFCVEGENLSTDVLAEVEKVCKELSTLSECEYDERSVSDSGVGFFLNAVTIKSAEDFDVLTSGYKKLAELVINDSDSGGSIGEYRDMSGADVRLMKIDYDENDMPYISIAEVK